MFRQGWWAVRWLPRSVGRSRARKFEHAGIFLHDPVDEMATDDIDAADVLPSYLSSHCNVITTSATNVPWELHGLCDWIWGTRVVSCCLQNGSTVSSQIVVHCRLQHWYPLLRLTGPLKSFCFCSILCFKVIVCIDDSPHCAPEASVRLIKIWTSRVKATRKS